MDFTREPVIETVITPREGCKLVVRSSKGSSQEEYFVDAVEVVSFGSAFFFRSLEKPKCFLLPVVDYEILEVREARMVLKHVGSDRSIKIGGGRKEKVEKAEKVESSDESKQPKKRERRQPRRRRKPTKAEESKQEKVELPPPSETVSETGAEPQTRDSASSIIRSLLGSPPPLISETIGQYRESFQQAFYEKTEEEENTSEEGVVQEPENLPVETKEELPVEKKEELPVLKEEELPVVVEEEPVEKKSLWDFTD